MSSSFNRSRFLRRVGFMTLLFGISAAVAVPSLDRLVLGHPGASTKQTIVAASSGHAVLTDEWQERISRESTWRSGGTWAPSNNPKSRPSKLQGPPQQPGWFMTPAPANPWMTGPTSGWPDAMPQRAPGASSGRNVGGIRTVCVRTCDGYFFPISFGASEANFGRDQTTCSNACPGAKLFYYRPGSQDPEDMVDLSGQRYSKMKNADLFRTQYVESCKCKPHPWEQQAVEKHRIYALEDQRRKGNRAVVAELTELKTKSLKEKRDSIRQRGKARRPAADEGASRSDPKPVQAIAQLPAPRSDASRGQGTDRSVAQVVTSSISAAASAATVQSVSETAATANAGPAAPPPAAGIVPVSRDPSTLIVPGTGSEPRSLPAVDAVAQPEPVEAAPIPELPQRNSRKADRKNRAARAHNRQPVRNADTGSSMRSASWARNVFNQ